MITVLAYDIGTTGVKTCLFEIGDSIVPIDSARADYGLTVLPGGGVEQDPDEWWEAMVSSTRVIAERQGDRLAQVDGISFSSQQQSLVLVDEQARHVHPSMSYMDQRSTAQIAAYAGKAPRVAGINAPFLARSLWHTGAVSASVKDPVWKYHWLRENRPEEFARGHKWLDVKDALIAKMTGEFVMSEDSAFATLLYDVRSEEMRFSPAMLRMLDVRPEHLPRICASTDVAGVLLPDAAAELGLPAGTKVFAGAGDVAAIAVGSGATEPGETHVYIGTSGWVSTVSEKRTVDTGAMIATIVGAQPGRYNYFAELETAGKCLEWVRDHLALDEIDIYLRKHHVAEDPATEYATLYDYLSQVIASAAPGAGGVLFAPWLHGNRCPFEDPDARGMFVGLGLDTGKTEMLRAVIEGVCFHMRWFVETEAKKVTTSERVRFVGGGALSDVTAQILADVLQRGVDVVANPQDTGAVGAALIGAVGLGEVASLSEAPGLIEVVGSFEPDPATKVVYDRMFAAFTQLHKANRKIFALLSQG